jgi:hypothetical protein
VDITSNSFDKCTPTFRTHCISTKCSQGTRTGVVLQGRLAVTGFNGLLAVASARLTTVTAKAWWLKPQRRSLRRPLPVVQSVKWRRLLSLKIYPRWILSTSGGIYWCRDDWVSDTLGEVRRGLISITQVSLTASPSCLSEAVQQYWVVEGLYVSGSGNISRRTSPLRRTTADVSGRRASLTNTSILRFILFIQRILNWFTNSISTNKRTILYI